MNISECNHDALGEKNNSTDGNGVAPSVRQSAKFNDAKDLAAKYFAKKTRVMLTIWMNNKEQKQ